MNSIEDLSRTENEMISSAPQAYDRFYLHAEEIVRFTFSFINKVDIEAQVFIIFLSQIQKSLCLSLLSIVRRHDVQTQMMLRHVLESAVLASYSLFERDIGKFAYTDENGNAIEITDIKDKANRWLEENYKTYNDKIKFMKTKVINKTAAHANIISAFNNYDFNEENSIVTTLFDTPDDLITKQRLWWISNISFGLLDLFNKLSHDFPYFSVQEGFTQTMSQLGKENKELENTLRSEERFAKYLK